MSSGCNTDNALEIDHISSKPKEMMPETLFNSLQVGGWIRATTRAFQW